MMENAITKIGFDPQALWITFGTLIAAGTVALLVMQIIRDSGSCAARACWMRKTSRINCGTITNA